jgi:parallel beta-helix repeat protein
MYGLRCTVVAALVSAACTLLLSSGAAWAKLCGGATPCACGDTVAESITLDADLGICDRSALRITSAVVLDCAGHTITGNDLSNAKFGIEIDGAVGAVVKNCRVTKFRRGIRINGGSKNVLRGNESFENKYGFDLAGETRANVIKNNLVRDSRDEGIHLGESPRNRIVGNEIRYSKRENLYLLRSNGNLVKGNYLHHGKASAIYVKHSSRNRFVRNKVFDTALQLRGGSMGNVFTGNYLKGDGYLLEAYQEPTGWTYPSGNAMSGDCIRKTDVCYRFVGAFDNSATDARTDGRCAPPGGSLFTLEPLGGQEATGNVVELADASCNDEPF